jgi:hypothetical protein
LGEEKEYVVVHSEADSAKILEGNQVRAVLKKAGGAKKGVFHLESETDPGEGWMLTSRVDGEVRPFSMVCYPKPRDEPPKGGEVLKIRDHIFSHNNSFYSIGKAMPVGTARGAHLRGSKFICRLLNFQFEGVEHVDEETKHRMKGYRGVAVGEIYGLGAEGYHVKFYGGELSDVELPLAASTYLLYTTR